MIAVLTVPYVLSSVPPPAAGELAQWPGPWRISSHPSIGVAPVYGWTKAEALQTFLGELRRTYGEAGVSLELRPVSAFVIAG